MSAMALGLAHRSELVNRNESPENSVQVQRLFILTLVCARLSYFDSI